MEDSQKNNPQIESASLPTAMNSQQANVFDLLQGFSAEREKFHEWYLGAIQILSSASPDKIAQAAHSIRELCDRLPRRIANIPEFKSPVAAAKQLGPQFLEVKEQSYEKGWTGETINQPLDAVLCRLEKLFSEPPRAKRLGRALTAADPHADFLSKDWRKERDKVFEDLVYFFQNVAHHAHLANELEFKGKLELFESLLLNYLTPCTAAQQKELLGLMISPVTSEKFAKVSQLIKHKTANFTFFFEKLENPDWLPVLDQNGYFKNLPEPEPTDNGRVMYRHYLPMMVLTRLAGTAPQAVTDILVKLNLPENPHVGDQVLQCMTKIRDSACIKRMQPLIQKLGENSSRSSWLWIDELLKSWMELNVFPEIFAALKGYLNRVVDLSSNEFPDESNVWLTKQIDGKYLEQISSQYPFETVALMFQALCKWVDRARRKYSPHAITDAAPTSHWLEDFKSSPPDYRGIEGTLATRLYSAAKQIYQQGDLSQMGEIDKLLRSHPWQLFRRVRWQLYADFPAFTLDWARDEVLQKIPFLGEIDYNRGSHDYEFAQLLTAHVKQHGDAFLSPSEVQQFVSAVMKGPTDNHGDILEGDNTFFYQKQLWPIAPLLRGEQLSSYRVIVPDDNHIAIESYKPYRSGGFSGGEIVSVAPPDDLESMSDEQLWTFLNTWEPK